MFYLYCELQEHGEHVCFFQDYPLTTWQETKMFVLGSMSLFYWVPDQMNKYITYSESTSQW